MFLSECLIRVNEVLMRMSHCREGNGTCEMHDSNLIYPDTQSTHFKTIGARLLEKAAWANFHGM